jgi:hypothetical protein
MPRSAKANQSGLSLIEAVLGISLLMFLIIGFSQLGAYKTVGVNMLRAKGEVHDLRRYVRESLNCENTVAHAVDCSTENAGTVVDGYNKNNALIFPSTDLTQVGDFHVRIQCGAKSGDLQPIYKSKDASDIPQNWKSLTSNIPNGCVRAPDKCPAGYVEVAEYSDADTATVPEFCVMKYEAKILGEDNGFNPTPAPSTSNPTQLPDSRPSGVPWVRISRNGARVACNNLNDGSGFIYSLITNAQWQSLARQIERAEDPDNPGVFLNWQNGSRSGANALNRGHTNGDSADPYTIAADANDTLGCVNIGSETFNSQPVAANCGGVWHLNKRTHILTNGKVIWDMSGNASEWVNDDSSFGYGFNTYWYTATDATGIAGPLGKPKAAFGPWFDDYWSKSTGVRGGLGYGYTSYLNGTIVRGGCFDGGDWTGIFDALLTNGVTAGDWDSYLGFRCTAVSCKANKQNPVKKYDVDDDGSVTATDVMLIVNQKNADGARTISPTESGKPYFDVNGDCLLNQLDVDRATYYLINGVEL